ncbi:MAG: DUF3298 and DUF4163 domain-containing protein [Selenomonas sp.]|uniref:DUF3298 and DUF4163 domain-containing protein n=1 Tax=Selenomonas sp. TaxID=2053611 RepID=UPI0025F2BFCE|nr:DUF3298 and DUF4163 domain-containing protein [Selenomonas sp.]MCR5758389.1 DUF3298 and DUF4163 domain-containing protein [Selenomonas sp.]
MKKMLCFSLLAGVLSCLWIFSGGASAAPRSIGGFSKQIYQSSDLDRDARGEYELLAMKWAGLVVNEEIRRDYPLLSKALMEFNRGEQQRIRKVRWELNRDAADFRRENPLDYHPFGCGFDVQVCRADTLVFSFLQKNYTNGSGAHGLYDWQGVNYNTLTGTKISLSSVITDENALVEAICQRLRQGYPQSQFDNLEETIKACIAEDKLNWSLDPRGVTFYFNPYEIASYAEGLLTATILFAERPDLFTGYYSQTAKTYAQPFDAAYALITSLKDDERRDVIAVEGGAETVRVTVNGMTKAVAGQLTDLQPVLVHMEDGRNYLYIDGQSPDSSRQTMVIQLGRNTIRCIDTLPFSFRHTEAVSPAVIESWQFLTNPEGFYFDRSGSFTSTTQTDICAIGEKGELTFG